MRLVESFKNLWTKDEKLGAIDSVVPMILNSYGSVGGWKGHATPENLASALAIQAEAEGLWKIATIKGHPVAVQIFNQTPFGLKGVLTAKEGKPGSQQLNSMVQANWKFNRSWSEVSGPLEAYLERKGFTRMPADQAIAMLAQMGKGQGVTQDGPDHYIRMIAGKPIRKTIMAPPDLVSQLIGQVD